MKNNNLKVTDIVYISFIAFLFLGLILFIPLNIIFLGGFMFPFYLSWVLFFVACPIILIFQIMDKEKTILNKILLTINSIVVLLIVLSFVVSSLTAFCLNRVFTNFNSFENFDKLVNQIKIEEPKFEHKNSIVNYIDEYKKQNDEYPKALDEKVLKNKKIEKVDYEPSKDLKSYKLKIYYKKGKVEQLEHSENVQTGKNGENSYHYSFYSETNNK